MLIDHLKTDLNMEERVESNKRRRLSGEEVIAHEEKQQTPDAPPSEPEARAEALGEGANAREQDPSSRGHLNADLNWLLNQQRNADVLSGQNNGVQQDTAALQQEVAVAADTDPLVAHLRRNILNQQIQRARLQAAVDNNPMAYSSPPGGGYVGSPHVWSQMNAMRADHANLGMNLPGCGAMNQHLAAEYIMKRASLAYGNGHRQLEEPSKRVANDPPADKDREGSEEETGNPSGPSRYSEEKRDSPGHQNAAAMQRLLSMNSDNSFFPGGHGALGGSHIPGQSHMLHQFLAQGRGFPHGFDRTMFFRAPVPGNFALGGGGQGGFSSPHGAAYAGGVAGSGEARKGRATGRQAALLYMSCDEDDLSPYQIMVRKQIELFEASTEDTESNARGRNRPIILGQVGIRCKHCKHLPLRKRERAAIYYPSKLDRLYQAGQTMASIHLGQNCQHIPKPLREELARLREGKSAALAGKRYWSDAAKAIGVYQDDERLFFSS